MIATIQQIQNGVSRYITEELARKKTGPAKFLINFLESALTPRITHTLVELQSTPLIGPTFFDENGNVRLTELADAARSAMEKSNNSITAFGFVFDASDIDKLINYITHGGQN